MFSFTVQKLSSSLFVFDHQNWNEWIKITVKDGAVMIPINLVYAPILLHEDPV